jgi:hypothetical protein
VQTCLIIYNNNLLFSKQRKQIDSDKQRRKKNHRFTKLKNLTQQYRHENDSESTGFTSLELTFCYSYIYHNFKPERNIYIIICMQS